MQRDSITTEGFAKNKEYFNYTTLWLSVFYTFNRDLGVLHQFGYSINLIQRESLKANPTGHSQILDRTVMAQNRVHFVAMGVNRCGGAHAFVQI